MHVSDIYNDLYKRLQPQRYTDGPLDRNRLEAGLAWEQMLEEGLKKRVGEFCGRPGELISPEGIKCSPDLVLFNGSLKVGEIKLTWMSMKEMPVERATSLPPKFEKWAVQCMAYAHLLDTNKARLIAFFVNGDYNKHRTPTLRAWDIEFTARELRENWELLIRHARVMGVL